MEGLITRFSVKDVLPAFLVFKKITEKLVSKLRDSAVYLASLIDKQNFEEFLSSFDTVESVTHIVFGSHITWLLSLILLNISSKIILSK